MKDSPSNINIQSLSVLCFSPCRVDAKPPTEFWKSQVEEELSSLQQPILSKSADWAKNSAKRLEEYERKHTEKSMNRWGIRSEERSPYFDWIVTI